MKPLSSWELPKNFESSQWSVACDLDDTLTDEGLLPSEVLQKLERLQKMGVLCVLVTGRSAGWVDALVKLLPWDAIVGENGAWLEFWAHRKAQRNKREEPTKLFWTPKGYDQKIPAGLQDRFAEALKEIQKKFPRVQAASDQRFRVYDLAVDFAEEVDPPHTFEEADEIRKIFESLGATAKVSSIHVNGWWGGFSKVDGLKKILAHYQLQMNQCVYVGDSPNDAPLFEVAGVSVGVENIHEFSPSLKFCRPQFVCSAKSAKGALEVFDKLLRAIEGKK